MRTFEGDLLMVIDMQNVYLKGKAWECLNTEGASKNIIKLLESGVCDRVMFTKYIEPQNPEGVWEEYNREYADINAVAWNADILDELKPYAAKYPVYEKSVYGAFMNTDIREACRGAKRIVMTGVVAECCVLSSIMGAIDEGYQVIYLTDAVSGFTEEKERGVLAVLSGFIPMHVLTMTVEEYIKSRKKERKSSSDCL